LSLLALDLSTRRTGWCLQRKGKPIEWGSFDPGDFEVGIRTYYMAEKISRLAKWLAEDAADPLEHVVAEDIGLFQGSARDKKQNLSTLIVLAELRGAVAFEVRRVAGIGVAFLPLSTVRATLKIREELGLKGAPKKQHVQQWLERKGYKTGNDDEADAVAVFLAADKRIREGWKP
jgi:hypothetical protein